MAFLGFFDDIGKYIYLVPKSAYSVYKGKLDSKTLEKSDVIILSATEEFSRTDTAKVTEHPVSSGRSHADHYNVNPATITFRGTISPKLLSALSAFQSITSDSSAGLGELTGTVKDYLDRVSATMRKSLASGGSGNPLFYVNFPDGQSIDDCVITSFSISRDSTVSDGYKVDVTVQEVLFAETKYSIVAKNDIVASESTVNTSTGVETATTNIAEKSGNTYTGALKAFNR